MCMATRDSEVRVVMIEGDTIYRPSEEKEHQAQE
jgi:hypothetical protein